MWTRSARSRHQGRERRCPELATMAPDGSAEGGDELVEGAASVAMVRDALAQSQAGADEAC